MKREFDFNACMALTWAAFSTPRVRVQKTEESHIEVLSNAAISRAASLASSSSGVSICNFVLVKQAN